MLSRDGREAVLRVLRRNYHFLGVLKKLSCVLIVASEQLRPSQQLEGIGAIHILFFVLALLLRPYNTPVLNAVRLTSDLTLILYIYSLWELDAQLRRILASKYPAAKSIQLYYELGEFGTRLIFAFVVANFVGFLERTRQTIWRTIYQRSPEYRRELERQGILILKEESEEIQLNLQQ